MAISLRSANSANCGATRTNSAICPAPGSIVNGDILVGVVSCNNNTVVVTPPAGFSSVSGSPFHDAASSTIAVMWKQASGESGSYTFSLGATTRSWCVWVGCYQGVDTTTPIDVTPTTANATGAVPTMTTTIVGCALLAIADFSSGAGATTTFTPPSAPATFTEEIDQHTATASTENSQSVNDLIWSGSGATGTMTITGVSTPSLCCGVALRPSGAAPAYVRPKIMNVNQAVNRAMTRCQKLTQRKSGLFVPAEWAERLVIA